jgi:hypothetical protein
MDQAFPTLSKPTILSALSLLNHGLAQEGIIGELCLFGGAAMMLAFDARESTRDIDGIFVPKQKFASLVSVVGTELGLPENWLNDGVKGFVSPHGEFTDAGLPQYSHLRLLRPTASYLLAMKCLAARVGGYDTAGDTGDVLMLCRHLQLNEAKEILAVVSHFYPDTFVPVKTRFFVEELFPNL